MTWVAPIQVHNAAACIECGHRNGDHHVVCGCQHLTPVYDERGSLVRHDRCECKEGVEREHPGTPPCEWCGQPSCGYCAAL